MAEPLETNSLELRMAFHNAVSRLQDWTANVAEPREKLRGKFCPISEVCEEVAVAEAIRGCDGEKRADY